MRLLLTLAAVVLCTLAGWQFYPQLYKTISGKEAPIGQLEKEMMAKEAAAAAASEKTETPAATPAS